MAQGLCFGLDEYVSLRRTFAMLAKITLLIAPFFVVKYIVAPMPSGNMVSRDGVGQQIASEYGSGSYSEESNGNPHGVSSTVSIGLDAGVISENAHEPIVGAFYYFNFYFYFLLVFYWFSIDFLSIFY